MANTMGPVLGDQEQGNAESAQGEIDMDALAAKIVALLLRELEIETERAGKLFQGR